MLYCMMLVLIIVQCFLKMGLDCLYMYTANSTTTENKKDKYNLQPEKERAKNSEIM